MFNANSNWTSWDLHIGAWLLHYLFMHSYASCDLHVLLTAAGASPGLLHFVCYHRTQEYDKMGHLSMCLVVGDPCGIYKQ